MKIELTEKQAAFLKEFLSREAERFSHCMTDAIAKEHVDKVMSIVDAIDKASKEK